MRGLDAYICGINDPSAPFNQIDWAEQYESALDKCDWITEEMLSNDAEYQKLGELMEKAHQSLLDPKKYYGSQSQYEFIRDNAQAIADKLKALYNKKPAKKKKKSIKNKKR